MRIQAATAQAKAAAQTGIQQAEVAATLGQVEGNLAYLMSIEVFKNNEEPAVFPSLLLTGAAALQGLAKFESTLSAAQKSLDDAQEGLHQAYKAAGIGLG